MIQSKRIQTVAIVGAGAMGCLFAARIAETGARVTLIEVDEARLQALATRGIELTDNDGTRVVTPGVSTAQAFAGPVDLVILFTKGLHNRAAAQSVRHLAEQGALALTIQNGVGNAEVLAEVFPPDRVVMGTANIPSDIEDFTRITSKGRGTISLGGFTPEAQAHAQAVADLMTRAKWETTVFDDVRKPMWEKLAFNAALNPLGAVLLRSNMQLNNPPGLRIALAVVAEACAVARALGIAIDQQHVEDWVRYAVEHHGAHKASMTQDREAGRPSEIETINGAVEREGARLGIPTPVTSTLADLMRTAELS